jgi:hypothetical protein
MSARRHLKRVRRFSKGRGPLNLRELEEKLRRGERVPIRESLSNGFHSNKKLLRQKRRRLGNPVQD